MTVRQFTSTPHPIPPVEDQQPNPNTTSQALPPVSLPHLSPTSEVHVIPIAHKTTTYRRATATGNVIFSSPSVIPLVRSHALKKGDVLAVARIAGIQAVKRTAEIVPLAHSGLPVEGVSVRLEVVESVEFIKTRGQATTEAPILSENGGPGQEGLGEPVESRLSNNHGGIKIVVEVQTTGKTGVEMEALTGVMGTALTIVDMCKGVDKHITIEGVQVLGKEGGKSGAWGVYIQNKDV